MGWQYTVRSLPFVEKFLRHILHTPHSREEVKGLMKIEMIVVGVATLMMFLMVAGWLRRNRRLGFFHKLLFLGFIAVPALINNTLGRLKKIDQHDYSLYLVTWVTLLLIGHASADSINAMEVPRNYDHKTYILQFLMFASLLGWFILEFGGMTVHLFVISVLWVVIILKVDDRARALWYASQDGVTTMTKGFADHMIDEHNLSQLSEVNSRSLKGCKYVVDVTNVGYDIKPPSYRVIFDVKNAVTIDKIWECEDEDEGDLLNSRGDPKGILKDLCLSMSLFWLLLLRRFGGYNVYESDNAMDQARRFVQQGLLMEGEHERMFRVIEVELMFLYDFLYTKYFAGYMGSWQFIKRYCQLAIIVTVSTFYIWLTQFLYESSFDETDLVTWVALTIFTVNEIVQIIFLLTSEWSKVSWICWYVRREPASKRRWGKIIRLLCRSRNRKRWTGTLGQYSLLRHHDYNPCIFRILRYSLLHLVEIPRVGQKESPSVKLSQDVKKTLLLSLRKYFIKEGLEKINGISVWKREVPDDDLIHKYCKLETQAHVILVWHIATSFCNMSYAKKIPTNIEKNLKVANRLSMYCAYLVAFAPKLLPLPEKTTLLIFDLVIEEANKLFKRKSGECCWFRRGWVCKSKYQIMSEIESDGGDNSNIRRGALLGKHLMAIYNNNHVKLWDNLAEFWAEMLLFLAPSDDHMIHAEHLAKGGELITHFWALLTHAGIVHPAKFVSDQTTPASNV